MTWAADARERVLKVNKLVKENIQQEQGSDPATKSVKERRTLKAGDKCMVHFERGTKGNIGTNVKFEPVWDTGYVVLKQVGESTYQVQKGRKLPKSIHIDRLKLDTSEEKAVELEECDLRRKLDERRMAPRNANRTNGSNSGFADFRAKFNDRDKCKLGTWKKGANKRKSDDLDDEAIEIWNQDPRDKLNGPSHLSQQINNPLIDHQAQQDADQQQSTDDDDDDDIFHEVEENLNADNFDEAVNNEPPPVLEAPAVDGRAHRPRGVVSYKEARSYTRRK